MIDVNLTNNNLKEQFLKIKSPNELMNFLDGNISYGWIDFNNRIHYDTLKEVKEKYRTSSIEEVFNFGVVTCVEDAKLVKYFFDKIGIENKMFCYRLHKYKDNDEKIKLHFFVVFKQKECWYHFEHSMTPIKGIRKYESLEEALDWITGKWNKDEMQLIEIPNIPNNLSFKQLNEYVDMFEIETTKHK